MKAARHAAILELIENNIIETQDDLADRLRESGFKVTQATVSRDIKEIRLIKVLAENGKYKYATIDKAETGFYDKFLTMFSQTVLKVSKAGNLIILKTLTGSASVAGEAVDSMKLDGIEGTIAGDNTVFCAVKDSELADVIIDKFQSILNSH